MTTPHRPSSRLPTDSGPHASFLKRLLDKINGTGTPAASCSSKYSRASKEYIDKTSQVILLSGQASVSRVKLNQDTEKRAPSVWVGGSTVAQDAPEKLRASDETQSKKTNTFPEEHHGLGGNVSTRPRPHLGRLTTQFPAPSYDEVAQSSSEQVPNEAGLSSTASHGETPSSALASCSTRGTTPPSHLGSGNNSPRKRPRVLGETECQHVSKKMRSMALPDLLITANSERYFTMNSVDGFDSGNVAYEKALPDRTVACTSISPPDDHQHLKSPLHEYSVAMDDRKSAKMPRTATSQPESGWQQTLTTTNRPETPETPIWARPFHLVDTSFSISADDHSIEGPEDISIYKSVHGDTWAENPLCEYCFRQRGLFKRVLEYGCESCGREECLRDYYWKPAVGSNY